METRVLTLFDDEAFFPQETPKEKSKKEKEPQATGASESQEAPENESSTEAENTDPVARANDETPETIVAPSSLPETPPDAPLSADAVVTDTTETIASSSSEELTDKTGTETPVATTAPETPSGIHKEWPAPPSAMAREISIGAAAAETVPEEAGLTFPKEEDTQAEEVFPESPTDIISDEAADAIDLPGTTQENIAEEVHEAASDELANDDIDTPENVFTGQEAATEAEEAAVTATEDVVVNEPSAIEELPDDTTAAPIEEMQTPLEAAEEISDDPVSDVAGNTTVKAADQELNEQILSELIQLDYTALMQKDYSFDLGAATVVSKEKPKKTGRVPEPIPVEEEQEEEAIDEVFEEVVPLPEWKLDKKYYTIGEVAQLFQVNTSHIRFWTNEFKIKPRTTRKGDRLYSPKDIAELRLIHHLVKVKKHTIKGAREKLKAEKSEVNNKLDLKESLVQLKDTLLKIRDQL